MFILIYHSNEGSAMARRLMADQKIDGMGRKFIVL